jgi:hypothetical protein
LRGVLYEALRVIRRGGIMLREGVDFPCRVCARGVCKPLQSGGQKKLFKVLAVDPDMLPSHAQHLTQSGLHAHIYRCDFCQNLEFFHFPPNQPPPGWLPAKD